MGKKAMVVAAVANTRDTFSDIVEGKGGGCVLLLHGTITAPSLHRHCTVTAPSLHHHCTITAGPPGVGKTLTAEATAEYLRRPLYTLTSGELGTKPTELEENLSRVLGTITAPSL